MKTLYESLFDVDDNIESVEKIKDKPEIMFNRNCKDFEEVVEVFARWFDCKPPKITKSSKVLKQWDNKNGIRLHNDKIAVFNLSRKYKGDIICGKIITLALWDDTLLIQYRRWDMVYNWSNGRKSKVYDKDIYLAGNYNDDYKYKWGTNLWKWIKMLIDGYDLPKYAFNKSDYLCESIFDIDDNIDNLDNLFKFWKCSSLNQYKKMMDEFENFTYQFPAKPNARIYDYISNEELEKDIWYIKFHSGMSARQFTLFRKDDTDYIGCVWGRGKVNITLQRVARGFIKSVAHPVQSTFKLPKSFDVWVEELKKYVR